MLATLSSSESLPPSDGMSHKILKISSVVNLAFLATETAEIIT